MIAALHIPTEGALTWRPHLSAVLSAIVIAAVALWVRYLYRRMRTRMSVRRTLVLITPKLLAVILLVLALFDPLWTRTITLTTGSRILAVLDMSSSMDVRDGSGASRRERAVDGLARLRKALPASVGVTTLYLDTELHDAPPPASGPSQEIRGTDLGAGLLGLSERADLSSYAAVVLLTDGGDEPVNAARLPDIPLHIVGVGSALDKMTDLAVADVQFPALVEKETEFEITVDTLARAGALSVGRLARTRVVLERQEGNAWRHEAETVVNLTHGRARARLKATCPTAGLHAFRVSLDAAPGEVSLLNNSRTVNVEARNEAVHVLYFARDIGVGLKVLRAALAPDPGIALTCLFRTTGERYSVQGERPPGTEDLDAGFPADAKVLEQFDCVILGAFPDAEWRPDQLDALTAYAKQGGAVVFLGGETAYSAANAAAVTLAPMFPWQLASDRETFLSGAFPVSLPPAAASHSILAGIGEDLLTGAHASVESVNRTGRLKPGATRLLSVMLDRQSGSLAAVHRYGEGTVLALASNTFWRWARESRELGHAYGLFWRQAVRFLSGSSEGGQLLQLKWDKAFYRPGERAELRVRTTGDQTRNLQLSASVSTDGHSQSVAVEPVQGRRSEYQVALLFDHRGEYGFSLTAHENGQVVESYEKTLPVGPLLGEGAKLEIDRKALVSLAARGGGSYVKESQIDALARRLAAKHLTRTVRSDRSILSGSSAFAVIFLCILVLEWILRRIANLY